MLKFTQVVALLVYGLLSPAVTIGLGQKIGEPTRKGGTLIRGEVADHEGKLLVGVEVQVLDSKQQSQLKAPIRTGPDGRFEIRGLKTNDAYKVIARATGYIETSQVVTLEEAHAYYPAQVTLVLDRATNVRTGLESGGINSRRLLFLFLGGVVSLVLLRFALVTIARRSRSSGQVALSTFIYRHFAFCLFTPIIAVLIVAYHYYVEVPEKQAVQAEQARLSAKMDAETRAGSVRLEKITAYVATLMKLSRVMGHEGQQRNFLNAFPRQSDVERAIGPPDLISREGQVEWFYVLPELGHQALIDGFWKQGIRKIARFEFADGKLTEVSIYSLTDDSCTQIDSATVTDYPHCN